MAVGACGYFAVWSAVGAALYPFAVAWETAAMRWAAVSRAVPALTGLALIAAGALQFTWRKQVTLACCRASSGYVPVIARGEVMAGWTYGVRQGRACGICCAGPMIAMVALGAMNPVVMTGTAAAIALEKLMPNPRPVVRLLGVGALGAGAVRIATAIL